MKKPSNEQHDDSTATTINNLPKQLLTEILRRLPEPKSIFRCNLVCKYWYHIIYNYNNININININNKIISHFVPQFPKLEQHNFPVFLDDVNNDVVKVIASCNDLLLCRLSECSYCICNPLTKQYVTLPPTDPIKVIGNKHGRLSVGFMFDNRNDDDDKINYTVVFICAPSRTIRLREYSSLTKRWRDYVVDSLPRPTAYPIGFDVRGDTVDKMFFNKGMWFWYNWKTRHVCCYDPRNTERPFPGSFKAPGAGFGAVGSGVLGVCRGVLRFSQLARVGQVDVNKSKRIWRPVYETESDDEVKRKIIAKVWELKDLNSGEWSLVHEVYLNQLGDLWHAGVTRTTYNHERSTIGYRLSAKVIDPNDTDIIYITVGADCNIVSCNFREMEMKLFQAGPFVPGHCDIFPGDLVALVVETPREGVPIYGGESITGECRHYRQDTAGPCESESSCGAACDSKYGGVVDSHCAQSLCRCIRCT
ncbi:hypothetical protein ACFE04_002051 [Oxalis oulophora]